MSKTVLLIDGNNKMWASYHAYRNLSHKGSSTSSIFGFTTMLRSYVNKFKADRVYVVWDGKKSEVRLAEHPEYKGSRKSKDLIDFDDWKRQKAVVQRIVSHLGVRQVWNSKNEADDVIYAMAKRLEKKYDKVIVVSSDKDFNQMVNNITTIWVDKRSVKQMITIHNMQEIYGYEPQECVDYLCLDGDTSDNIPGYPGMGPVKIRKFLDEWEHIQYFLDSDQVYMETKKRELDKKELAKVWKRNRLLIDLKHHYKKSPIKKFNMLGKAKYDEKAFRKLVAVYGLTSIMGTSWLRPFKR